MGKPFGALLAERKTNPWHAPRPPIFPILADVWCALVLLLLVVDLPKLMLKYLNIYVVMLRSFRCPAVPSGVCVCVASAFKWQFFVVVGCIFLSRRLLGARFLLGKCVCVCCALTLVPHGCSPAWLGAVARKKPFSSWRTDLQSRSWKENKIKVKSQTNKRERIGSVHTFRQSLVSVDVFCCAV